jgi:hypothetical protein
MDEAKANHQDSPQESDRGEKELRSNLSGQDGSRKLKYDIWHKEDQRDERLQVVNTLSDSICFEGNTHVACSDGKLEIFRHSI